MSRFRGPRVKVMRALGVELPGLSRKSIERRAYPPGQHGPAGRRRKQSDYGRQMGEKQKIKFNYGLSERPLRRLITEAFRSRGVYAEKLVELLERRLDNVVFRAGLAPTIPAARQLVTHGHIVIDGKRVDIPSYRVKLGQSITIKEKSRNLPVIVSTVEAPPIGRPTWIDLDQAKLTAKIIAMPDPTSMPFPVNVRDVIEYYSRRISK